MTTTEVVRIEPELVRIGQVVAVPPRLVQHAVGLPVAVEHRVEAAADALSLTELAGRIDGLLRLRQRCLAEHRDLLDRMASAPTATERHHLRLEAAGVLDAAHGCQDEVVRLRALAGLLVRAGAAW